MLQEKTQTKIFFVVFQKKMRDILRIVLLGRMQKCFKILPESDVGKIMKCAHAFCSAPKPVSCLDEMEDSAAFRWFLADNLSLLLTLIFHKCKTQMQLAKYVIFGFQLLKRLSKDLMCGQSTVERVLLFYLKRASKCRIKRTRFMREIYKLKANPSFKDVLGAMHVYANSFGSIATNLP